MDKEFQALSMDKKSHAQFRVKFESALVDMGEASMDVPSPETLYRKYISKISSDLRDAVLGKLWVLDGDDCPSRKPKTWEEVADCCEQ